MTDSCFYYRQSRRERDATAEERRITSLSFYYEKGCLNGCDGDDRNCPSYLFIKRVGTSVSDTMESTQLESRE